MQFSFKYCIDTDELNHRGWIRLPCRNAYMWIRILLNIFRCVCGEDLVSCVTNKYVPEKKAKKSGAYPNRITSHWKFCGAYQCVLRECYLSAIYR